jgi:hypothetical protein
MPEPQLLDAIRRLAASKGGLFQVHRQYGSLYARARRRFGSWAAALRVAGFDYDHVLNAARQRSLESRRQRGSRRRAV